MDVAYGDKTVGTFALTMNTNQISLTAGWTWGKEGELGSGGFSCKR